MALNPQDTTGQNELIYVERERRVWQGMMRGLTLVEIAAEIGSSKSTVHRIARKIEARAIVSMNREVERVKAVQIKRYQTAADQAWEAWEASKKTATKVTRKRRPALSEDGVGFDIVAEDTVYETQHGDTAYLGAFFKAMEAQADLLGIKAPQKHALTDPSGKKMDTSVEDAQRARIAELMSAAMARRAMSEAAATVPAEVDGDEVER